VAVPAFETMAAFDFESVREDSFPAGFVPGLGTTFTAWTVILEADGNRVLSHKPEPQTDGQFTRLLVKDRRAQNIDLSVRMRAAADGESSLAGLIARYRDADNYYLLEASLDDQQIRLFNIDRGRRFLIGLSYYPLKPEQWFSLRLVAVGDMFQVFCDDRMLFDANDRTFRLPGGVGLETGLGTGVLFDAFILKVAR
jgi:hypothetical protein